MKDYTNNDRRVAVDMLGWVAYIVTCCGSPLVALLPASVWGWVLYLVGSIMTIWYSIETKAGKPLLMQFIWFAGWNVAAIVTRCFP